MTCPASESFPSGPLRIKITHDNSKQIQQTTDETLISKRTCSATFFILHCRDTYCGTSESSGRFRSPVKKLKSRSRPNLSYADRDTPISSKWTPWNYRYPNSLQPSPANNCQCQIPWFLNLAPCKPTELGISRISLIIVTRRKQDSIVWPLGQTAIHRNLVLLTDKIYP